jgi:hypothetical protein
MNETPATHWPDLVSHEGISLACGNRIAIDDMDKHSKTAVRNDMDSRWCAYLGAARTRAPKKK